MKRANALFLTLLFCIYYGVAAAEISEQVIETIKNRVKEVTGIIPVAQRIYDIPPKCGTPIMLSAFNASLLSDDPDLRMLQQRPDNLPLAFGSQHFIVHYATGTGDAPYREGEDINPSDGIPDYINRVSEIFEHSWFVEVDSLGFAAPLPDQDRGGDNRYDVYVRNLGFGYFGFTTPEQVVIDYKAFSFIEIENDFAESITYRLRPLDGASVTAAHELMHAIQFSYDAFEYEQTNMSDPSTAKPWWLEASSTWMEDIVYDEINDYVAYLSFFYKYMWMSLTTFSYGGDPRTFHPYASCVWPFYMTERFNELLIMREIWEQCGAVQGYNTLPATNSSLVSRGSNIIDAFQEFSVWNFHTGALADTSRFFSEGNLYPEAETTVFITDLDSIPYYPLSSLPRPPEDMAANIIVIQPNPVIGGVNVDFNGMDIVGTSWQLSIAGYRPTGSIYSDVSLNPFTGEGSGGWHNWDSYDAVVLIPVVSGITSSDSTVNSYDGQVAYDAALFTDYDVGVIQFLSPSSAGRKSDPIIPIIRFSNLGRNPADFSAHLVIIHGDTVYDESVAVNGLDINAFADVTFLQYIPVDIGLYLLHTDVDYALDQFALNDTLTAAYSSIGAVGALLTAYPSPYVIESQDDRVTIPFSFAPGFDTSGSWAYIYDISGGLVQKLPCRHLRSINPGYSYFSGFEWNGRNSDNGYVASGVYIFMIDSQGSFERGKIALINKMR